MLSTRNIHYRIGKKLILNGINADFLPGKFNMILGPNGSGKSSFLKIFSGDLNRYDGNISYANTPLEQISKEKLASYRAVMSQQPELSFPLLVEEVVMMGRYPHFHFQPNKKDHDICHAVMERMNLLDFRTRNYLTLSGGEKQRVQFARGLAQIWEKPADGFRYLFLDEPLTSLDINYQQEFLQIASSFCDAQTVIIAVIHDINLAIQYADQLFFMKAGELIAQGSSETLINEDLISKVFDVSTSIMSNPVTGKPLVLYNQPLAK